MKLGKYYAQLNYLSDILKSIKLLEEYNPYPDQIDLSLSEIRRLSYRDLWKKYYTKNCYHFHLIDNSLIYFNITNFSYSFIDNPFTGISFKDFILENDLMDEEDHYLLYPDYEQYLSECSFKESPLPIRYDYDENSYNEGLHPVSHLHMGEGNKSRIGLNNKLDPESFVYLIIRQLYPDYWIEILNKKKYLKRTHTNKKNLDVINRKYYNLKDHPEMYLK